MGSERRSLAPWAFLLPFLAVFGTFFVYPLVKSLLLAFQQTYGPGTSEWVGTQNFRFLASDPLFWTALRNTVVFTLASVFIQLPLALLLAMALNREDLRARSWFRLIFFSPSLVGIVFVGMMFAVLLEEHRGLVNIALAQLLGVDGKVRWLQEFVMGSLIVATLWMYVGFNMVYFLAALQNVKKELVEAAIVDGAGPVRRFFAVTLPAIRPVAGFVTLLSVIGSFQLFELPFILLSGGGGPNNRGLTIVMYLYQNGFEIGDLGYASAIGWVLAVILIASAGLQRVLSRGEASGA
jgi:ABC-type sugar transport system permease subunit